jgi:psiF repeat
MLTRILFPSLSPKEMHMTKTAGIMVVSLFALGLCVAPFAIAAPAQQNKMKTCNAEATAKGLGEGKGDERKAFMKECLSAKPEKATKAAAGGQQNKMKMCNKEAGAKKLKGDDRKTFMSTCLSS